MHQPQRLSKTLTAKRRRADRAAAVKAARTEREAARANAAGTQRRAALPHPGTAAWRVFAIGAVKAAEADAKRRKRWKPDMRLIFQGRSLTYSVTTLGRVLVQINSATAAGRYGALWGD